MNHVGVRLVSAAGRLLGAPAEPSRLVVLRRAVIGVGLLAALASASTAAAAPPSGATPSEAAVTASSAVSWGVRPVEGEGGQHRARFRFSAGPGDRIQDALVVTNRGRDELSLRVDGAHGEVRGDLVELAGTDVTPAGLATWLDIVPELDLAPGESVEVPFSIDVPAGIEPGDHAGGVVTSSLTENDAGLAVDHRLAVSVVVTVRAPGDAHGSDPSPSGGSSTPTTGVLLAVGGLLVIAVVVWVGVVRRRANT